METVRNTRARRLVWPVLAALALGCGSEERSREADAAGPASGASAPAGGENAPPEIESVEILPEQLVPGHPIRAEVRASDPDGDRVQLRYAWQLNGSVLGDATSEITLREVAKGDEITLTVVATDGDAETPPVTRSARIANRPPTLFAVALEAADVVVPGRPLVASPRADDPDGDELSYTFEWRVNGEAVDASGPELPSEGLKRGDRVEVVAVASDGEDESEPQTSQAVTVGNTPPRILSHASWQNVAGEMRYTVEAEDPDGDRSLRYRLLKAPENMQIDPLRGEIRWKPGAAQKGKHPVEIEVDDLRGGRTVQRFEMSVNVEETAAPETARAAGAPDEAAADEAAAGPEDEDEVGAGETAETEGSDEERADTARTRTRRGARNAAAADEDGAEAEDDGSGYGPAARDPSAEEE